MEAPIIEIKGLNISYGNKRVLTNIYLNIDRGQTYGLVGPNGAGKSTLFKAVLDLIDLSSGSVKIFGGNIDDHRKKIAYIPQKDEVDWTFPATVLDIVLMGRYPYKKAFERMSPRDVKIAMESLEELGISDLAQRQIGNLSGGQQQRVFIARALAQEAELFFMDEPFVGVDMTTEDKIITIMKKLAGMGKTLLVVHHDLSTVESYFSRVILLNQRLIAFGDTAEVFTPENIKACYGPQLPILQNVRF